MTHGDLALPLYANKVKFNVYEAQANVSLNHVQLAQNPHRPYLFTNENELRES